MSSTRTTTNTTRYLVIAALVVGAFFGAYRFALARGASPQAPETSLAGVIPTIADGASTPACACCGSSAPTENGITGDPVEGAAVADGGIQRIDVDLSKGYYEPNIIVLEAGVPSEITFGQSSGCTAQVTSEELGFLEDLSAGPRTVTLPALDAGEYTFSCGMQMVFGKIVVR